MRGVSVSGHSANYVETEQLVEYDKDSNLKQRYLTSFVQVSMEDLILNKKFPIFLKFFLRKNDSKKFFFCIILEIF